MPRPKQNALAIARTREGSAEGQRLYTRRQGIESTLSQAVRAFGLRQTRYRGLAKTGLQHVANAAAINFDRVVAWSGSRPIAYPHVTLCRSRRMTGDFATSVPPFKILTAGHRLSRCRAIRKAIAL